MLPAAAVVAAFVATAAPAPAQSSSFSGPFVGVDVGQQHLIGGALVDGVDTLQQDSRLVGSAVAGLRGHVGRLVLGGEFGVGRTDGDLILEAPARDLIVRYENRGQWHWALTAGPTIGAGTVIYAYLWEVTRQFDVTVVQGGVSTTQNDEQGLLRYGVGVEHRLRGPLHVRVTAGTSRADFGGRATNITIGRRLDASVAVLLQF